MSKKKWTYAEARADYIYNNHILKDIKPNKFLDKLRLCRNCKFTSKNNVFCKVSNGDDLIRPNIKAWFCKYYTKK